MTQRSLILCATPRSGSTLLCRLIASSCRLGQPDSWFRRQSMADLAAEWGLGAAPDWPTYLAAARRAGTDGSGRFALRLMWQTLPELCAGLAPLYPAARDDAALLAAGFGRTDYVYLVRDDPLAQAVSRLRAEQTGWWHPDEVAPAPRLAPQYDADRIAAYAAEVAADNAGWTAWFAEAGIAPHRIAHRDLVADPAAVLQRLVAALGLTLPDDYRLPALGTAYADELSAAWIARFRAEAR